MSAPLPPVDNGDVTSIADMPLLPDQLQRDQVSDLVRAIQPWDEVEREHQGVVGAWIASGADLYRVAKPDVPPMLILSR